MNVKVKIFGHIMTYLSNFLFKQELFEKHKCPLVQNSKGLYTMNYPTTTVPSLVIIKQMVHKILSGQC